jgi:hypothetical protein
MRTSAGRLTAALLVLYLPAGAVVRGEAQTLPSQAPSIQAPLSTPANGNASDEVQQMMNFKETDVKFSLRELMDMLRDHRHEGWVLSTYADPTTHLPLIGAGFSLDLAERDHPQRDWQNPNPFLEPSSAQLWQAAGLDPEELPKLLQQFDEKPVVVRVTRRSRRRAKAHPPAPQISDEQAESLLRVAVVQAILNAKAYCRDFDNLTASQQMAMTQLVYQMGVNLDEFSDFLSVVNSDPAAGALALGPVEYDAERWRAAQESLVDSRWATLYRIRAIAVIAMLDPRYLDDPLAAETRISALLPAPVIERSRAHPASRLRDASFKRQVGKSAHKQGLRARKKA